MSANGHGRGELAWFASQCTERADFETGSDPRENAVALWASEPPNELLERTELMS